MKRICILSTDANVAEAKEIAKAITSANVLTVPASENGKAPATHWFCCLSTTDEGHQRLLELQKNSVIEESAPKIFLSRWKLKIIK
jgi:hypothetical protein